MVTNNTTQNKLIGRGDEEQTAPYLINIIIK